MAFCIYILAFVNRNNATKLGMGLLVLGKAFATARALTVPCDQMLWELVAYGPQRTIAVVAVLFGGVAGSVFISLWSALEVITAALLMVVHTAEFGITTPSTRHEYIQKDIIGLAAIDVMYTCVGAVFMISFESNYRSLLVRLFDTLEARQRFITTMVSGVRPANNDVGNHPWQPRRTRTDAGRTLTPSARPRGGGGDGGGIARTEPMPPLLARIMKSARRLWASWAWRTRCCATP